MKKLILTAICILTNITLLSAQEVYLRLTDYGGSKIVIMIEPFTGQGLPLDKITVIKNMEVIIKNDLDYSLYFTIVSDTFSLHYADNQAVVLKGSASDTSLAIILEDFQSREPIMRKTYGLSGELRRKAHQISNDIIEMLTGEKGIALTRIAFSYYTAASKELAMVDYDGYNFTVLTRNGKYNIFPTWAPDGNRLLFSTFGTDRLILYLFDLAKREIKVIAAYDGLNFAPCWSPDGTKIAMSLSKDGDSEIYVMDIENRRMNRLTYTRAIDTSPSFSPNGREIAFVSDRSGNPQIYIMDTNGGNVRRLTYHGSYNTSPAWSPRGDLIVYVSREADNSQQIYITDPNDFAPVRLTYSGNNEEPSWSPDGLHIVFSSNRSGRYELYTMNWDGSRLRRLTSGLTANAPDWSP